MEEEFKIEILDVKHVFTIWPPDGNTDATIRVSFQVLMNGERYPGVVVREQSVSADVLQVIRTAIEEAASRKFLEMYAEPDNRDTLELPVIKNINWYSEEAVVEVRWMEK